MVAEAVLPLNPKSCKGKESKRWKAALKEGQHAPSDLEAVRLCFAKMEDWAGVSLANEKLAEDPIYGRNSMTYYFRGASNLFWTGNENYQQCFQSLEKSLKLRSLGFCSRLRAQVWQIICLDRLRTNLAYSELGNWPDPSIYLLNLDNDLGSEEVDDLSKSEFACHKWATEQVSELYKSFDSN